MTPELKSPSVTMPFNGFTQQAYAQKMIDEYKAAGVRPSDVFPQSFDKDDVLYWINREPAFGRQAVFLDDANTVADLPSLAELVGYRKQGIRIWAPPTFALLALNAQNEIVPSQAARNAKTAGLDIITWSLERSGHPRHPQQQLLLSDDRTGDHPRGRPDARDRRPGARGRRARHLLRLGRPRSRTTPTACG